MEAGLCFTHGKNRDLIDIFCPSLGSWIKIPHGIQFVTEEFCSAMKVIGLRK